MIIIADPDKVISKDDVDLFTIAGDTHVCVLMPADGSASPVGSAVCT